MPCVLGDHKPLNVVEKMGNLITYYLRLVVREITEQAEISAVANDLLDTINARSGYLRLKAVIENENVVERGFRFKRKELTRQNVTAELNTIP
ncbi:hypothetical protein TNCV_4742381 [Trichonephila clavipes]|nr:hypothetical protein TNCV_4742381 [Trichonephila clavipes]